MSVWKRQSEISTPDSRQNYESVGKRIIKLREKVLFDINVILDVLENREPHVNHSGPALLLAEKRKVEGCISASSVDTLAFLLRKSVSKPVMYRILDQLTDFLTVLSVDESIISNALNARWKDPEDAILFYTAVSGGCLCLITRNVKDFEPESHTIKILKPNEFMTLINDN